VTASSTYPGYAPERAADGRRSTELGGEFGWSNDTVGALPQWLELDLRAPRLVGRVDLYTTSGYELGDYRIQRRDGDGGWSDLAAVTGNTAAYRVHTVEPVRCERLRVLCERGPVRQPGFARVNEIEVYPPQPRRPGRPREDDRTHGSSGLNQA
jgi:hypothetical protein